MADISSVKKTAGLRIDLFNERPVRTGLCFWAGRVSIKALPHHWDTLPNLRIGVLEQRFLFVRYFHDFRRLWCSHRQDIHRDTAMDHIERLAATVFGDGPDDIDGVIAVFNGDFVSDLSLF